MPNTTTVVATSTYVPLSDRDLIETVDNKAGCTTISKYEYEYSPAGRRENVVNTGSAFSQNAHNVFAYNDRGEVVESKRFQGTDPQNPGSELTNQRRLAGILVRIIAGEAQVLGRIDIGALSAESEQEIDWNRPSPGSLQAGWRLRGGDPCSRTRDR